MGQRLMAMVHTAQWRAMTDYGRMKNVDIRNVRTTLAIPLRTFIHTFLHPFVQIFSRLCHVVCLNVLLLV
jgi:hypothetical protein